MSGKTSPNPPAGAIPTRVNGIPVYGIGLDAQGRCAHYATPADVVALQFHCCGVFFACSYCHAELAKHLPTQWPLSQLLHAQVVCGQCGNLHSAQTYLAVYRSENPSCPTCQTHWNPGCKHHLGHYYQTVDEME